MIENESRTMNLEAPTMAHRELGLKKQPILCASASQRENHPFMAERNDNG